MNGQLLQHYRGFGWELSRDSVFFDEIAHKNTHYTCESHIRKMVMSRTGYAEDTEIMDDFLLPTSYFLLPTSYFLLPTSAVGIVE